MADLRLSFRQQAAPAHDLRCVGVSSGDRWSLEPGQRIVMRAPSGSVRVLPESEGVFKTTPFRIVTVAGANLVAVRPVKFRLTVDVPNVVLAQVCAEPALVEAAQSR
jgi:hypothetical protein